MKTIQDMTLIFARMHALIKSAPKNKRLLWTSEISILIEFVKQNENDSRYEADICTDALKGTGDIVC